MSRTVTFDTNVFPAKDLIRRARAVGYKLAAVSVTDREAANTSFVAQITEPDSVSRRASPGVKPLRDRVDGAVKTMLYI